MIERQALDFRRDDDAGKAEINRAALEFGLHFRDVQHRRVGEADETAGMLLLDLAQAIVDELAFADIRLVEARTARQHAGVDARAVHHAQERLNIRQQRIEQVIGIAVFVELDGHARRIALLQFRRRVVGLEVDDHVRSLGV